MDPSDSGEGKFPVDSLDVWPIVTGESTKTLHDVIVLRYNYDEKGTRRWDKDRLLSHP